MNAHSEQQRTAFVLAALDRYERPLTRYAMRLLDGDEAAARDVVQHAFLKLCEQDCQTLEDRLAAWLYTVCRNRAVDEMRGRDSTEKLERIWFSRNGAASGQQHSTEIEETEFLEKLWTLIDDLPPAQREILELWSQGLSSVEIAEITGKQSGAIRVALHRTIRRLQQNESVARWLGEESKPSVSISRHQ